MPYEIVKSSAGGKKGYRVKKQGTNEYFSKEAIPLEQAKKQRTAIAISESKRPKKMTNGGIVPNPLGYPPVQGRPKDYGDVVFSVLEPGEVVIPVQHSKQVMNYLRKNNIKLPGM
jgi:hypothetical protein